MKLNINQQSQLANVFGAMDMHDAVVKNKDGEQVVKVCYKLGAGRRSLVKNLSVLSKSIEDFQKSQRALVKEIWPNIKDGEDIAETDDPTNFAQYRAELTKIAAVEEEIDLQKFTAKAIYEDNEFPVGIPQVLELYGLIETA